MYKMLKLGDIIEAGDEAQSDDQQWYPTYGNFEGVKYVSEMRTMRRKVPARPELVANLPEGTECVGLVVFKEKLFLATKKGVYFLNDNETFEPIKFIPEES